MCNKVDVFQTSLPFYASLIIDSFTNSRILAKNNKDRVLANREILILLNVAQV